jgi:hypothetical protein
MRRAKLVWAVGVLAAATLAIAATAFRRPLREPVVTHEVIAVYLGTLGTDAQSGIIPAVREMRVALAQQAAVTGRRFISRGVSLEPSVDSGLRHIAMLGSFDEVSVGGNWTNSAVVRYLGANIGTSRSTSIPQVILLEREIGRYIGGRDIEEWVRRGAPLPR